MTIFRKLSYTTIGHFEEIGKITIDKNHKFVVIITLIYHHEAI